MKKNKYIIIPILILMNLLTLLFSEKIYSENALERSKFHFIRATERRKAGDNYGTMSDYNMVININAEESHVGFAYFMRSFIKSNSWGDGKGYCEDLKIASTYNFPARKDAQKNFNKYCVNQK